MAGAPARASCLARYLFAHAEHAVQRAQLDGCLGDGRCPRTGRAASNESLLRAALTFDAAITGSELIVEGTVEEVMFDGLAFRLAVEEVFKGTVGGREVRIGPTNPEGRGCEVGLQVGQHVVLGIVDIQAPLNSLATAVWFVAADGSLSSPGSLWEVATDIDDLRAKLRQAVPDTALPVKPHGAPASTALTVLGLVSLVLASAAAQRAVAAR